MSARQRALAAAGSMAWPLRCGRRPPARQHASRWTCRSRSSTAPIVTSVSRSPEPVSKAPAGIFVITADDIRRSGATTLPEALRLAPNLEVARIDTRAYAITARGFDSSTANKRLVIERSVFPKLVTRQ